MLFTECQVRDRYVHCRRILSSSFLTCIDFAEQGSCKLKKKRMRSGPNNFRLINKLVIIKRVLIFTVICLQQLNPKASK